MKTRHYLIKIIWCAVIILSAVGCSTSEEVFDEDYVPTEEDIVETLKKVNTEWGTSKESIMEYMKGYKAVDYCLPVFVWQFMFGRDDVEKRRR